MARVGGILPRLPEDQVENRAVGFISLLSVIVISILFGMLLGGRLNAPRVALAAPSSEPLTLASASGARPESNDFADIVEQTMPAVVSITSAQVSSGDDPETLQQRDQLWQWFFGPQDRHPNRMPQQQPRIGEGSGFLISTEGYVLTNYHVVEEADQIRVGMQSGRQFKAEVVGTDPSIDLALLKIDPEGVSLPSLPLGDSEGLRVGQWVIAIGNPLDYEQTVTVGVVSAKERRVPIGGTDSGVVSFIQTDAAINFGNSGGPLLDARGNVIGINTAIRRTNYAEGIGFALPINHARRVIEQLRETGSVRRGYIGINMNADGIDEAARDYYGLPDLNGVIVDTVSEDGPAERAGLQPGDVIREVNGEKVRDNLDLISKIASRQPGDKVSLKVLRKGKALRLEATLQDREEGLRAASGGPGGLRGDRSEIEDTESRGLGLTVRTLGAQLREQMELERDQLGVVVSDVEFGSQAAEKGIRPNMIITAVNDEPIRGLSDWNDARDRLKPGAPVKLDVLAGPRRFTVFLRMPGSD